jgi:hypothetical protein
MQAQDSSDPTGVSGTPHGTANAVTRSRHRKSAAALALAIAGATYTDIAKALGYPTPRTALVAVELALERELRNTDDREKMRKMVGARLDRLLRSVWATAIDPDAPDRMVAVTKAREIIADHRKLFGLDAPTEIVVHNPTQAELEAWVARVTSVTSVAVPEYDILDAEIVENEDDVSFG